MIFRFYPNFRIPSVSDLGPTFLLSILVPARRGFHPHRAGLLFLENNIFQKPYFRPYRHGSLSQTHLGLNFWKIIFLKIHYFEKLPKRKIFVNAILSAIYGRIFCVPVAFASINKQWLLFAI